MKYWLSSRNNEIILKFSNSPRSFTNPGTKFLPIWFETSIPNHTYHGLSISNPPLARAASRRFHKIVSARAKYARNELPLVVAGLRWRCCCAPGQILRAAFAVLSAINIQNFQPSFLYNKNDFSPLTCFNSKKRVDISFSPPVASKILQSLLTVLNQNRRRSKDTKADVFIVWVCILEFKTHSSFSPF